MEYMILKQQLQESWVWTVGLISIYCIMAWPILTTFDELEISRQLEKKNERRH